MIRGLLFLFLFVFSSGWANVTIKSRLLNSTVGDYIVLAQGSNYSLLAVKSIKNSQIVLEQITTGKNNIDLKKICWEKWIENRAPGASSWIAFTIDLEKDRLVECFSYLQNQWLFIEQSDYIFGHLLNLALRPTRDRERKRIGPAPMTGEMDRRKLWKPQLVIEGKKIKTPQFEILRTTWPRDKTRLAGCIIELYLDKENPKFPFPHWMEIQSPHYTFKLRSVDSGHDLYSHKDNPSIRSPN